MKKLIFIMLISTFCFGKWVMVEGKHHTNDTQAMYMYNDETGAIYIGEPIYTRGKDGKVHINVSGFQRVPFIISKTLNGKHKNTYEWQPYP